VPTAPDLSADIVPGLTEELDARDMSAAELALKIGAPTNRATQMRLEGSVFGFLLSPGSIG
jgi:hypothetical protein